MNSIVTTFNTVKQILENMPVSWLELTTHRLDTYDETQAKAQFLEHLHTLCSTTNFSIKSLESLPTAYDYVRLGHQLSSILEWLLAQINQVPSDRVITFTSKTIPILAILRKNTLSGVATHVYYDTQTSPLIDRLRLEQVYGYQVDEQKITNVSQIPDCVDATVIFVTESSYKTPLNVTSNVDVTVKLHSHYGSAVIIHNDQITDIVKDVQHARRRESIAMTPINTLNLLQEIVNDKHIVAEVCSPQSFENVNNCIKENTGSTVTPLVASSGLSIQYAMIMGLLEDAMTRHPNKAIKLIIPPNCYGGTNEQARRIADLITMVEIVDLHVDNGQDLVGSLDIALTATAQSDSVPIILVEIPTNPRVEVPNMSKLAKVLTTQRTTQKNTAAVKPVFTLDQTFCPNVKILHNKSQLAKVKTISYSSGSKFPSGGRCLSGFCTTNNAASSLQPLIEKHLVLTDNKATANQLNTLADNMPSMPARITKAYNNTRTFVEHIQCTLPQAKINFISQDLADQGFTPSVFALDLPSIGATAKEREDNKKSLNLKLIEHMIHNNPMDCKHCVSYGQLKGSYWTIPATSTQGSTIENDKDYIVRVALSPDIDIVKLAASFDVFCQTEGL